MLVQITIMLMKGFTIGTNLFLSIFLCVNSSKSTHKLSKAQMLYVKFVSHSPEFIHQ